MTRRRPDALVLELAAAPATVAAAERVIEGLAVPYGPVGYSSMGPITFAQGSLTYAETGRVKFLKQHNPDVSLGYALELDDRPDGMWSRFAVGEGPEGDTALAEAADGRRDGLSVGVQLSEESLAEVIDKWWEGDTSPTAVTGRLLEVSQVSIPAFDDARIPSAANTPELAAASLSGVVTLSVQFAPTNPEAPAPATPKEHHMTTTDVAQAAAAAAAPSTAPAAEAAAPATAATTPSPAAVLAGMQVTERPVYTFDGTGPSFVRDMWHARFSYDRDAQDRVQKFNARWTTQDAAQVGALTAAVETRTTAPSFIQQGYKPELLVEVIDKGRPLVSRIGTVPLADATPFRLPVEGEMTGGVGDHTEGEAHVAEGDLDVDDALFTPGAISGAFRLSREVIDATNPALDQIALRAMMRNYRYATEAKAAAVIAAAANPVQLSIDTVQKLRLALNAYYDRMQEDASAVAAHSGFYAALLGDVDTTGRPMLASVGPQNAAGTPRPGHTGADVDGTEVYKAYSVTNNDAYLYAADDIILGESSIQTFRFEEVEGPGVVKLALWSYFGGAVTRAGSVDKLTSDAADA